MSQPTVAILGASANRSKYGNKSLLAHAARGYDVYPVNPRGGVIDGIEVYRSIGEVPVDHLNRISVYVPPAVGIGLLEEIAAKGCDELWLNPGSDSAELLAKAKSLGLNTIVACSLINVERRSH